MSQIILDAEAGQVSAELARRGIPPHARVHVLVHRFLGPARIRGIPSVTAERVGPLIGDWAGDHGGTSTCN
jgi:hypothetical protein